jgi:8-oxo-dGTP pyrophosphatase MutT (NUDIX family)
VTALHDDAVRVVTAYEPYDPEQADLRRRTLALLAAESATLADNPGAHVTASTLVLSDDLSRVLLCLHGRVGKWLQLGGHCEPEDGGLLDAALREATEESGMTGLRMHPVPVDLDVHPVPCRYGPSQHYDVRFICFAPAGAEPVTSAESKAVAWFAPDALPTPLGSATDRLIAAGLRAATASTGQR